MSLAHLKNVGTLAYNGFTFPGGTNVRVAIDFPQDDAGRTVLYSRHVFTVNTFVQDDSGTDSSMADLHSRLSKQGQRFTLEGHGLGLDMDVNRPTAGGLRDVKWGPKPKILHWEPVGSAQACEVVWECEVCIPLCGPQQFGRTSGVMAMNYSMSFAIDGKGFTTRTIAGYLEIAQTRSAVAGINAKNVPDSADGYRHLIQPDLPLGFTREQQWDVAADKSRVDFTITDTQIPSKNPYPQLVTRIDAKHRVGWSRFGREKLQVRNTLSVDVELAAGAPQALAWNIFGTLAKQRVDFAKRAQQAIFLDEVTAEEDIFGLSQSFSASWRVLRDIRQLFDFRTQGLWQPVAGTDWRLWRTSLSHVFGLTNGNRGLAGLVAAPQNDVIVDLCGAGTTIPWGGNVPPRVTPIQIQVPSFKNELPPANKSYLDYQMVAQVTRDRPVTRQRILQSPDTDQAPGNMQSPNGYDVGGASGTSDTIQQGGRTSYGIRLYGKAKRVGYEIPRPKVQSVGGRTVFEKTGNFTMEHVGNFFGVPLLQAAWVIDYAIDNAFGRLAPPISQEN